MAPAALDSATVRRVVRSVRSMVAVLWVAVSQASVGYGESEWGGGESQLELDDLSFGDVSQSQSQADFGPSQSQSGYRARGR